MSSCVGVVGEKGLPLQGTSATVSGAVVVFTSVSPATTVTGERSGVTGPTGSVLGDDVTGAPVFHLVVVPPPRLCHVLFRLLVGLTVPLSFPPSTPISHIHTLVHTDTTSSVSWGRVDDSIETSVVLLVRVPPGGCPGVDS